MNAPLTQDERAELDTLRSTIPLIHKAVADLSKGTSLLSDMNTARVLRECGAEIELNQIKTQIERAISFLDSGRPDEAKNTLMAMLILEKNDAKG